MHEGRFLIQVLTWQADKTGNQAYMTRAGYYTNFRSPSGDLNDCQLEKSSNVGFDPYNIQELTIWILQRL